MQCSIAHKLLFNAIYVELFENIFFYFVSAFYEDKHKTKVIHSLGMFRIVAERFMHQL